MTTDEALRALGHLAGAIGGFDDRAVDEFQDQFEKLDNADALDEVLRAARPDVEREVAPEPV